VVSCGRLSEGEFAMGYVKDAWMRPLSLCKKMQELE
jgi:hypothetical protein